MRVLHLIDSMIRGGAESVVIEHVRHTAPALEPWVVAINRGGPALEEAARLGAHTAVLGKQGGPLGALARLAALLREHGVHVVNGHNPNAALYGLVGARLAGVPVALRTEHSFHYPGRATWAYAPFLEQPATWLMDGVICVSDAVRESHVRRMRWLAARFTTIRNGIPDVGHVRPRGEVRAELGLAPGDLAVFTAGSLTPQKAHHVLVEAFAVASTALPGARLVIAGDGPLRGALQQQVEAAGIADRTLLLGARHDVPDLLNAVDVFVLSSVREGLPISLLEAMRASLPVVVTRVGGTREVVLEGEQGHLADAGDAEALAAGLRDILLHPGRARAFGQAARSRWLAHFTGEAMVRATEGVYRDALARRGHPEFASA